MSSRHGDDGPAPRAARQRHPRELTLACAWRPISKEMIIKLTSTSIGWRNERAGPPAHGTSSRGQRGLVIAPYCSSAARRHHRAPALFGARQGEPPLWWYQSDAGPRSEAWVALARWGFEEASKKSARERNGAIDDQSSSRIWRRRAYPENARACVMLACAGWRGDGGLAVVAVALYSLRGLSEPSQPVSKKSKMLVIA